MKVIMTTQNDLGYNVMHTKVTAARLKEKKACGVFVHVCGLVRTPDTVVETHGTPSVCL
jgi:hypothetical protein